MKDLEHGEKLADTILKNEPGNNFVDERYLWILDAKAYCLIEAGRFNDALRTATVLLDRRSNKASNAPSNPLVHERLISAQTLMARSYVALDDWSAGCRYFKGAANHVSALMN